MKYLGLMLIFISSVACGYSYVRMRDEHISELGSVCMMLENMQRELESRLTPLPDLFKQLSVNMTGAAATFMEELLFEMKDLGSRNFCSLWNESIEKALKNLEEQEIHELELLGEVLGRYGIDRQLQAIQNCLNVLGKALECSVEVYPQRKKLAFGLSLSAGALLAIVLV